MTLENDPGRNERQYSRTTPRHEDRPDNTWTWIIGAIAALGVLGGIYYVMSDRGAQVATDRPAATTGAGPTAGQGSNQPTTPPAQPAPANR
jgi:hypothetical protein